MNDKAKVENMKTVEQMTIEVLYREALKRHGACKPPFDERAYAHTALRESLDEFKSVCLSLLERVSILEENQRNG